MKDCENSTDIYPPGAEIALMTSPIGIFYHRDYSPTAILHPT